MNRWRRRVSVTTPKEFKVDRRLIETAGYALLKSHDELQRCIFLVMNESGGREPTIIMCGKASDPVFQDHIRNILSGNIPDPSKGDSDDLEG